MSTYTTHRTPLGITLTKVLEKTLIYSILLGGGLTELLRSIHGFLLSRKP